jgi:hypothetical protein
MPFVQAPDRTKLYYDEVGIGSAVAFVHEYAGELPAAFNAALADLFFAAESGRWLAHKKAT